MRSFSFRLIPVVAVALLSVLLPICTVHAQVWGDGRAASAWRTVAHSGADEGQGLIGTGVGGPIDTFMSWMHDDNSGTQCVEREPDPPYRCTRTETAANRNIRNGGTAIGASGSQIQAAQNAAAGTPGTGAGAILDMLTAKLVGFIAFMMGWVVSFLGKVILLLVNVLLGFLTYNGFADAPPVVIGWKMVRDLANMFFIVILIVASYGTILGRKDLHVRDVIPKVLLAAVLVNFSKTIVALLIDASQVVMLTFVNAFASIGAGNFTNALHLPLITSANYGDQLQRAVSATSTPAVGSAGAGQVILDVILASGLQIFLLVVAIGIMLMMIVFVVARIVGLWMLLIFSPMPFLADALPGSMKSMLGSQVGKFWGQLSGLLTGGPIMAFWLWLTFATLSSQGQDERLNLFQNTQAADLGNTFGMAQNGASMFITAIGNAQGLGSYLVAVAMMLMGLETAISTASAVAGPAGNLMKTIGNKTRSYAQKAALYGAGGGVFAAAGYAGASAARYAGASAASAVDKRYDVRGWAARNARRIPFAGQNKWLREQQFKNRKEAASRAKEMTDLVDNKLATKAERDQQKSINRGAFGWRSFDPAVGMADRMQIGKKANDPKGYDADLKASKDANKEMLLKRTDPVVAKRVSDRIAKQEANVRRIQDLERQKALITGTTQADLDEIEKIDDLIKKTNKENPHLLTDPKEREKQMKEVRQNWKTLDADARSNFEVMRNFATDGAFDTSGGKVKIGNKAAIDDTRKRLRGQDLENFNAMVKQVEQGGEVINGKFVNNGVDALRFKNMSVEQDANFKNQVFELFKNGDGTIDTAYTGYKKSDQDRFVLNEVETTLRDDNSSKWLGKDVSGRAVIHETDETRGAAGKLMHAAAMTGISQAVNSVGGSDATKAAPLRQAAMNTVTNNIESKLGAMEQKMKEKREFLDADGAKQERTFAELLKDQSVPAAMKDAARLEYEKEMGDVLMTLRDAPELTSDQQIALMGAMGRGGVASSLENSYMDAGQRRMIDGKGGIKEMIIDKREEDVNRWFRDADPTHLAEMAEIDAKMANSDPQTLKSLSENPALSQSYQQYRDYSGARKAISEFNNRKSGSKGKRRQEPKGGKGPRAGGATPAAGGAAPAAPAAPPAATGGAATT